MPPSPSPTEGAPSTTTRPIHISRGALVRWAIGAVIFGLAYGVALIFLRRFDLEGPATRAAEWAGVWGIVLFLALMMSAVMSPLPDSPIALAGLVAYGPLPGLCLVVLGSWLGAMADFLIVRLLGRDAFRRRFPRVAAPIDDLSGRLGFELLVVLRFLPTVSFDIVSYAAAITRMSFWHFAGATLLGQLPGPTVAAVVGANAGGASMRQKVFLSVFFAVLLIVLLVTRRIVRRRAAAERSG